ncbi:MAG: OsmC family protein [Thermoanaerobaculia bacterium]|jgi:peroxiredoxin-like protein|nr:OsmC family protein [Thermoanaerobaculia bacterium]MBP9823196.1 OsmC family protein [Thermoanaerobaculia bacterium]
MPELHSTYALSIRSTGGKQAIASSPDGLPDLGLASPPQFGGPGGQWTPEHLYVGSAAACWMTTFLAVAELSKLEFLGLSVAAEGFLEKGDDRKFSIARIVLRPLVTVALEADREKALRLIQKAEDACLVARSMRTTVELEPQVTVAVTA